MKLFFYSAFIALILFTTSSAGVIIPGHPTSTSTVEEGVKPSSNHQKARYQLSRKALRNMSSKDMARIMGREMTEQEKANFKANRKRFVKDSGMAEVKQTNTMAIIAFASSLLFPPLGIVLGIIALGQIKKSGEEGRGWATASIIVGAVLTLLLTISMVALAGFAG